MSKSRVSVDRVKAKPPAMSAVELLEQIKNYTQFESVAISPDGTVSVKFAGKTEQPKAKGVPVRKTAIDSLAETPPPFEFGKN